ncbi:hypothetical protein F3157_09180 [Virgibacillus dakarensis]|nr:hypothetical protein [Virgibacillus dakarensis]MTW85828.1 hypothetical protein [Virgibacillus dakarensis]
MLEGPARLEISDDQLEQLNKIYKELAEDVSSMLVDFFAPFELMKNEGVFAGKSADAYTDFCMLVNHYLKIRFDVSLQELNKSGESFKNKIDEVESLTI